MTHVRRAVASTVAVAFTALIAGCTSPEPSTLEVPDVVWPAGEPAGELEYSAWVQAVREAEVLSSVAWNNLDYSDPALIEAWGYDSVVEEVFPAAEWRLGDMRSQITAVPDNPRLVDAGPIPLLVLDVEGELDGARVTVCVASGWSRFRGELQNASIAYYHVKETSAGDHSITKEWAGVDIQNERKDECAPDLLPVGLFDPVPEPPTDPEVELKPPADPEAYG